MKGTCFKSVILFVSLFMFLHCSEDTEKVITSPIDIDQDSVVVDTTTLDSVIVVDSVDVNDSVSVTDTIKKEEEKVFAIPTAPDVFSHPGAMNSKVDLDFIKAKIAAHEEPWLSQFEAMKVMAVASSIDSITTGEDLQKAEAQKVYANALTWYITDEVEYADRAVELLLKWCNTFQGYGDPYGQPLLVGGWIGSLLGPGAEILKSYEGFKAKDISRVQEMFTTHFYPVLDEVSFWNGNVDLTQIDAMINIAVFNDDTAQFNNALKRFKLRVPAYFYLSTDDEELREYETIKERDWGAMFAVEGETRKKFFLPLEWKDGITQETLRDQGHHAQYGMASAIHVMEVAWNQGADLYGIHEDRFVATLELLSAQLYTGNMQGVSPDSVSTKSLFSTFEVGYNHYANRMGLELPNTKQLLEEKAREKGHSDWNIFFESLTHNIPKE